MGAHRHLRQRYITSKPVRVLEAGKISRADLQGYVATDMLGNAANEKEAAFPKEWDFRTPVGR
jgi:hypothetical protein